MSTTDDIQQQLRDAIAASGRSLNQLSQESGINDSQLSRFVRGKRTLTMETAAVLCRVLGLRLVPVVMAAKKKKGK
jgi:ribosome-binding protein aMBF1 (putative translation factor)